MKKILKKGDGMALVLISIVFIALVLIIVPAIKGMQKTATGNAKTTADTGTTIVDDAANISKGTASYNAIT